MNGEGEITNNYSEAYNSQMKITVSMAPNIFAILKAIQDEEAIGHQKIAAVLEALIQKVPGFKVEVESSC